MLQGFMRGAVEIVSVVGSCGVNGTRHMVGTDVMNVATENVTNIEDGARRCLEKMYRSSADLSKIATWSHKLTKMVCPEASCSSPKLL